MICPNCMGDTTVEMISDAHSVHQHTNLTYTCPVCGYSERR